MNEEELAAVFTEWLRQWREDPEAFEASDKGLQIADDEVDDYGHRCARAFLRIQAELTA